MNNWIRKHFEVFMLKIAVFILIGRNVERCKVISRKDNNDLWYMGEKIESVSRRILDEYQYPEPPKEGE